MRTRSISELLSDKITGEWGGSPTGTDDCYIIRTANFINSGKIDFTNLVLRHIPTDKVVRKKLVYGDILIEKSGGSPTQPVGRVVFFDQPDENIYLCNNFTTILRPKKSEVFPKYLFYALHRNYLLKKTLRYQNKTTGIINLKLESYLQSEIPLPLLDDQKRIAFLLGNVESLIAKRKQHLQELDTLLKSIFVEMFGDPVKNEMGWESFPCTKAVLTIESGASYRGEEKQTLEDDELGVLKISAVTQGTFNPHEYKTVKRNMVDKKLLFVSKGDFLFSRANTYELVAACCIVPHDYPLLFLPDKLWKITFFHKLNPSYCNHLFKNNSFRKCIRKLSSGGHDSMLNISMERFYTLNLLAPPLDLQNKFAAIVEKVERIKLLYQNSLTELENLYGALSQKAFKGELDLSKVPLPPEEPFVVEELPVAEKTYRFTTEPLQSPPPHFSIADIWSLQDLPVQRQEDDPPVVLATEHDILTMLQQANKPQPFDFLVTELQKRGTVTKKTAQELIECLHNLLQAGKLKQVFDTQTRSLQMKVAK